MFLLQAALNTTPGPANSAAALNVTALNNLLQPGQISGGLMVFVVETVTVLIEILMVLAISMQLARGYFFRVLRKFTLRLAADIWWLIYVILRDITVLLVLLLGIVDFLPAINLTYPLAVPFQPLGIVLYAFALVILLVKDTDENGKYDTMVTTLLSAGSGLYLLGTVFITESAVQLASLPPTVSASTSNFWGFIYNVFNSVKDPALEIYTFYVCFALLVIAGLIAIKWSLEAPGGAPKGSIRTNPEPMIVRKPATAPSQAPASAPSTAAGAQPAPVPAEGK